MRSKLEYNKICPQCGSTNIKMPQAGMDIRMTIKDKCNDCSNIGNFPEVEKEKIKWFKKNIKNQKIKCRKFSIQSMTGG